MNRQSRSTATPAAMLALAATAFAAPPAESPFSQPQPPFYGQVRPRMELNHKNLADTSHTAAYTTLRTRLGFLSVPSQWSELKIEFQDTRILGSEPGANNSAAATTVGNRAGVDLTQGYGALEFLIGEESSLKFALGRMKMSLGAGRFLSTLEWAPTARQLDGLAANFRTGPYNVTGFVFQTKDTTSYGNVLTTGANDQYANLSGLYASIPVIGDSVLVEAGAFYEMSRFPGKIPLVVDSFKNSDIVTLDARVVGKFGIFTTEQELLFQVGEAQSVTKKTNMDHTAWFVSSRVGVAHDLGKINVGIDAMSGDGEATDSSNTQYRASYWFAHNYFGWMDYFVNNPKYGVVDYRADLDIPVGTVGSFKPQYHYFAPQIGTDGGKSLDAYGQELNAEFHVTMFPKTNLVFGAGVFVPGDGAYLLGLGTSGLASDKVSSSNGYFLYFMPVFNF